MRSPLLRDGPRRTAVLAGVLVGLSWPGSVRAYIDRPPEKLTLPRLLLEFKCVGVFRVDRVDVERGAVRYVLVEAIQGREEPRTIKHAILSGRQTPEPLRGIRPGQTAVLFRDDPYRRALTLIGDVWYVSARRSGGDGWWRLAYVAPHYDLNCCFRGRVPELVAACKALLAGRAVVVSCRKRRRVEDLQFVRYDLRRPHDKPAVSGPTATRPAASPARSVAALIDALDANDPQVRIVAAAALGERGAAAAGAVGPLAKALTGDDDALVRRAVAVALGRLGGKARPALPQLMASIHRGYGDLKGLVGYEAAVAIESIDPAGTRAAKLLAEMLKDEDRKVRRRAAITAFLLGPAARPAAAALAGATTDAVQSVRYEAVRALGRIDPDIEAVLPTLSRALEDKDRFVREVAGRALRAIDPTAGKTAALWMRVLAENPDPVVRHGAAGALQKAEPPTPAVTAALERATKDTDRRVRSRAAAALRDVRRR